MGFTVLFTHLKIILLQYGIIIPYILFFQEAATEVPDGLFDIAAMNWLVFARVIFIGFSLLPLNSLSHVSRVFFSRLNCSIFPKNKGKFIVVGE